ncbi:ABC transporter ATP-binding protein [Splendidivirga corallicola]|uniref:ABC transporter ATP-binding protein n=1 Tax=Splendidivirga corallicola TaxID=3051826 RepID=UPI0032119521
MIEVSGVTKAYGDKNVVNNISFKVEEGETLVLLGTSGCGKTTTLKMLNSLIEPTNGVVKIDKKDITSEDPTQLRRKIGYVIQDIGLFPHYTVEQNIAVVPRLLKWDKAQIKKRSEELLEVLGLSSSWMKRFPNELSGGQQQRVGIARALIADPPVILMDEPFGALDPITRKQIRDEFKNIEAFISKTIVLVTHDVVEAVELGDKICLLHDGAIVQMGTPKDLIFSPKNDFVKRFFDNQRFMIELMVMTLEDMIPVLESRNDQKPEKLQFTKETSLFNALECVEESVENDIAIEIVNENKKPMISTDREALLRAFYGTKDILSKNRATA